MAIANGSVNLEELHKSFLQFVKGETKVITILPFKDGDPLFKLPVHRVSETYHFKCDKPVYCPICEALSPMTKWQRVKHILTNNRGVYYESGN